MHYILFLSPKYIFLIKFKKFFISTIKIYVKSLHVKPFLHLPRKYIFISLTNCILLKESNYNLFSKNIYFYQQNIFYSYHRITFLSPKCILFIEYNSLYFSSIYILFLLKNYRHCFFSLKYI